MLENSKHFRWICSCVLLIFHFLADSVEADCSGQQTARPLALGQQGNVEVDLPNITRPTVCSWTIKSSTNALQLVLEEFTLPQSYSCQEGYLQVHVGQDERNFKALDRWCGNLFPRKLQLSGHVVIFLNLQPSDSHVAINLTYTSIRPFDFCEYTEMLSGSGYLYSPGYGGQWMSNITGMLCSWRFHALPGHIIQVELLHVGLNEKNCTTGMTSLNFYDVRQNTRIGAKCNTDRLTIMKTSGPDLLITYRDPEPYRGSGFYLKYYEMKYYNTLCSGISPIHLLAQRAPSFIEISLSSDLRFKSCTWKIATENENEVVVMETVDYDFGGGGCSVVDVQFYDGSDYQTGKRIGQLCSGKNSSGIIQSSGRQSIISLQFDIPPHSTDRYYSIIKVYAISKDKLRRKHALYTATDFDSRVWIPVNNKENESAHDILIKSSSPGACVRVEISQLENSTLSLYDFFLIYDGAKNLTRLYSHQCTGKSYTYSTGPALLLQHRTGSPAISSTSPRVDGFWLIYRKDPQCDVGDYMIFTTHVSAYSSFHLPSSPVNQYNRREAHVCRYVVTTSSRWVIQLYMYVSQAAECDESNVQVSDDMEGKNVTGRWCSGSSPVYVSRRNRLYIQYTGTPGHNQLGNSDVMFYYKSELEARSHYNLIARDGVDLPFTSPYYPQNYPNNAVYSWSIGAANWNYRIEVKMQSIYPLGGNSFPKSGSNCTKDFAVFYDGSNRSKEITRWCGKSSDVRPVKSSGRNMYVEFHSDESITAKGFKALYKSVKLYKCNQTLTAYPLHVSSNFLSSPFFPNHYHDLMSCNWLIQTTEGHNVQIDIELAEFTGTDSGCNGDYLKLFDGRGSSSALLGKVCGMKRRRYGSTGSSMYIQFRSDDDTVTARGFQLKYYSISRFKSCRSGLETRLYANITETGYLSSPDFPVQYKGPLNCRWRISTDQDNSIQIEVKKSDVIFGCQHVQLHAYNGATLNDPLIGSWCGEADQVFTSSGSYIYLTVMSGNSSTRPISFKVSYKSISSPPVALSTGPSVLAVLAAVGAAILAVALIVGICCCCCWCRRRKRKKIEKSRKNVEADGKLLGSKNENTQQPSGFLIPTAPPMEGEGGLINEGFVLNASELQQSTSRLYPTLPSAEQTVGITDYNPSQQSNYNTGVKLDERIYTTNSNPNEHSGQTLDFIHDAKLNGIRASRVEPHIQQGHRYISSAVKNHHSSPESTISSEAHQLGSQTGRGYVIDQRGCTNVEEMLQKPYLPQVEFAERQRKEATSDCMKKNVLFGDTVEVYNPAEYKTFLKNEKKNLKRKKKGKKQNQRENLKPILKKLSSIECAEAVNNQSHHAQRQISNDFYSHPANPLAQCDVTIDSNLSYNPDRTTYRADRDQSEQNTNCDQYTTCSPKSLCDPSHDSQHLVQAEVHIPTKPKPTPKLDQTGMLDSKTQQQSQSDPTCKTPEAGEDKSPFYGPSYRKADDSYAVDVDVVINHEPATFKKIKDVPLLVPIPEPETELELSSSVIIGLGTDLAEEYQVDDNNSHKSLPDEQAMHAIVQSTYVDVPPVIPGYTFDHVDHLSTTENAPANETSEFTCGPPNPSKLKELILPSHWFDEPDSKGLPANPFTNTEDGDDSEEDLLPEYVSRHSEPDSISNSSSVSSYRFPIQCASDLEAFESDAESVSDNEPGSRLLSPIKENEASALEKNREAIQSDYGEATIKEMGNEDAALCLTRSKEISKDQFEERRQPRESPEEEREEMLQTNLTDPVGGSSDDTSDLGRERIDCMESETNLSDHLRIYIKDESGSMDETVV